MCSSDRPPFYLEDLRFKRKNRLGRLVVGPFAGAKSDDASQRNSAVLNQGQVLLMQGGAAISATVAATSAAWFIIISFLQVCVAPKILFGYRLCRSITCATGPILCLGFNGKSEHEARLRGQGGRLAHKSRSDNALLDISVDKKPLCPVH